MTLRQKINHIKRHRKNKRFAKIADDVHFAASESYLNGNLMKFVISPRLYHVINVRRGYVPKNIKNTNLVSDTCIITVPTEMIDTHDKLDYIKEWCGLFHKEPSKETVEELNNIPLGYFTNPELYWRDNIGVIKPELTVSVKEI